MSERKSVRSNRGSKMRMLMAYGEDLPEDTPFWSKGGVGADFWEFVEKVPSMDDEFAGEDSQEQDSVDSDFDIPEEKELETEVLGEVPEEIKKKKKDVYVDPKKRGKKLPKKRKDVSYDLTDEQPNKRRKNTKSNIPVATDRQLRQSTRNFTKERNMQREIEAQTPRKQRVRKIIKRLSQEQLLLEAQETEKKNLQSYNELKKIEDDKKKTRFKPYEIKGPSIIERSNSKGLTLTFMNFDGIPKVIDDKSPPYPTKLTCEITGLPAKYIDPLTKKPYATLEAYKMIRARLLTKKEAEEKKSTGKKDSGSTDEEPEDVSVRDRKKRNIHKKARDNDDPVDEEGEMEVPE